MTLPPGFPQNTLSTMRLLRVLRDELDDDKFTDATRHYWVGSFPVGDFLITSQHPRRSYSPATLPPPTPRSCLHSLPL
jgi:hypothetical protein